VKKYANRPFVLIGVNADQDPLKARRLAQEQGLTMRSFWTGPDGPEGPIPTAWHLRGWPMVFILDHEGIIRHKSHGGPKVDPTIEKWVRVAEKRATERGE